RGSEAPPQSPATASGSENSYFAGRPSFTVHENVPPLPSRVANVTRQSPPARRVFVEKFAAPPRSLVFPPGTRSAPSGPTTETMRGSTGLPFAAFAEIASAAPSGAEKTYSVVSVVASVAPEVHVDGGATRIVSFIFPTNPDAGAAVTNHRPV